MAEGKGTTPAAEGAAADTETKGTPAGTEGAAADAATSGASSTPDGKGTAPEGGDTGGSDAAPEVAAPELGTFQVLVGIGGLRDGVPWPAVGELIELPSDEAEGYIRAGYVKVPEGN
jgi:hypothetical protein